MSGNSKSGKRPMRTLTPSEKLEAINRVSYGGESKASVARDIGVPESTLRGWCKNADKIGLQVTNPTESDSFMSRAKKPRHDEPYNLSLKPSTSPPARSEKATTPIIARQRSVSSSASSTRNVTTAGSVSVPSSISPASSENDKGESSRSNNNNRAELSRMSAEFGLNRPEVNTGPFTNPIELAAYASMMFQNQNVNNQMHTPGLNKEGMLHSQFSQVQSGLAMDVLANCFRTYNIQQIHHYLTAGAAQLPVTAAAPVSSNSGSPTIADINNQRLLELYQQNNISIPQQGLAAQYLTQQTQPQEQKTSAAVCSAAGPSNVMTLDQQILYQHLTKTFVKQEPVEERDAENQQVVAADKTVRTKPRSVLDNLLPNNHVNAPANEAKVDISDEEAIAAGEKFLRWLTQCSNPTVTTLQVQTVRALVSNLKASLDRNGIVKDYSVNSHKGKRK